MAVRLWWQLHVAASQAKDPHRAQRFARPLWYFLDGRRSEFPLSLSFVLFDLLMFESCVFRLMDPSWTSRTVSRLVTGRLHGVVKTTRTRSRKCKRPSRESHRRTPRKRQIKKNDCIEAVEQDTKNGRKKTSTCCAEGGRRKKTSCVEERNALLPKLHYFLALIDVS